MTGLEITRLAPGPGLRGRVRGLAGFTERDAPVRRREVPFAGVVVVFSLGPDMLVDGRWTGSFAGGLYTGPVVTGHDGEQAGLQIDVPPLAARALLGVPMGELTDRTVALEHLMPDAGELTERLACARGWPERAAILDRVLGARAAATPPAPPEVREAYARLVATRGLVRVEALAREIGWSRRHLAQRFRAEVGLTPKAFARLLRFEHAVERLRAGAPLADAAFAAGYADQPHMNREFRALYGAPPGDLPFVQDGALAA